MRGREGQAAVEFAVGVFAFTLILSAIFAFAAIFPESARVMSMTRSIAGRNAQTGSGYEAGDMPERTRSCLPPALRSVPAVEMVRERLDFTIDLDELAATYMFGEPEKREVKLGEETSMPAMGLPRFEPATSVAGEEDGLL